MATKPITIFFLSAPLAIVTANINNAPNISVILRMTLLLLFSVFAFANRFVRKYSLSRSTATATMIALPMMILLYSFESDSVKKPRLSFFKM